MHRKTDECFCSKMFGADLCRCNETARPTSFEQHFSNVLSGAGTTSYDLVFCIEYVVQLSNI